MSTPLFNPTLLTRATMLPASADRFRSESEKRILKDPETNARVVFYIHPSGRILLDAIQFPPAKR